MSFPLDNMLLNERIFITKNIQLVKVISVYMTISGNNDGSFFLINKTILEQEN